MLLQSCLQLLNGRACNHSPMQRNTFRIMNIAPTSEAAAPLGRQAMCARIQVHEYAIAPKSMHLNRKPCEGTARLAAESPEQPSMDTDRPWRQPDNRTDQAFQRLNAKHEPLEKSPARLMPDQTPVVGLMAF